ncbi:MAG: four-carbon acid sugar kinase family protein [Spirochaetota bacterium]
MKPTKIVVLDDDPTGSQTVHSCLLLLRWDVGTLELGFESSAPLFFVLTNTRGMSAPQAESLTREVSTNIAQLNPEEGFAPIYVSRSDSTLRGHFPVETDVMNEVLGPFDAVILTPAFFEGGRITRGGTHYVATEDGYVPAHETPFAKDSVFGYSTAYLPDYVAEKTHGRVTADEVEVIPTGLTDDELDELLSAMSGGRYAAVDAETQADMDRFAEAARRAAAGGKRFLFRSAAGLLTSLAALPEQPVAPQAMGRHVPQGRPGVVICGSHVPLSTKQIEDLVGHPSADPVEVDVERAASDANGSYRLEISRELQRVLQEDRTPAVFTSRDEKRFATAEERLEFGSRVSAFLVELVRHLPETVGFIVSKGGITSNDILSRGLALRAAEVVGQIIPGCTVVLTPKKHRLPEIPVVIFPGNVGDQHSLRLVYERLSGR